MNSPKVPVVPFVDLSLQHQSLQHDLAAAVQSTIQRGDFILGQAVRDFEAAFAEASGAAYGVGVACGTDAIALGLQACGIGPGDEVILPANTFIATLLGVVRSGAKPVLVDCDPQTALLDLDAAERAITEQTQAIVPVHLYGQLVSPTRLQQLAETHNLLIFEDAAQAHLAERKGYRAGSIGTAAAFSFYPSKNLGAIGDGGMVLTQTETIAQTMRSLRNYGAPRKYYHVDFGTNSRLDTLQAAVLNLKLPHLEAWNRDRNRIAQRYDALLEPLRSQGIIPLQNQSGSGHVYHLYVMRVTDACPLNSEALQASLSELGVQTGVHYPIPCHLQPAFEYLGYSRGDFPNAEMLCQQILSLPMFPGLTDPQIDRVTSAMTTAIAESATALSA